MDAEKQIVTLKEVGTIKKNLEYDRRYGFIARASGQDIFFHETQCLSSLEKLTRGSRVIFELGSHKGRECAINVQVLTDEKNPELLAPFFYKNVDWKHISLAYLNLLSPPDALDAIRKKLILLTNVERIELIQKYIPQHLLQSPEAKDLRQILPFAEHLKTILDLETQKNSILLSETSQLELLETIRAIVNPPQSLSEACNIGWQRFCQQPIEEILLLRKAGFSGHPISFCVELLPHQLLLNDDASILREKMSPTTLLNLCLTYQDDNSVVKAIVTSLTTNQKAIFWSSAHDKITKDSPLYQYAPQEIKRKIATNHYAPFLKLVENVFTITSKNKWSFAEINQFLGPEDKQLAKK